MAWIGALAGAVIPALMGSGGSSGGGSVPQMYIPSGLPFADQNWQANQAQNQGQLNQYAGYFPNAGAGSWGGGGAWGGYQPQGGMPGGGMTWQMGMPGSGMGVSYGGGSNTPMAQGMSYGDGSNTGWYGGVDASPPAFSGQPSGGGAPSGGGGGGYSQSPYSGPSGLAATVDPAFAQSFQQSQGINYQPYLQASQQAGQQYGTLAGQAGQVGQGLYGEAGNAFGQQGTLQSAGSQVFGQDQQLGGQSQGLGYGQLGQMQSLAQPLPGLGAQVANTAFDPQQALYGRTLQQVTDQTNAANSMYGLGSSAAGAGILDQNLNNFNIDWQNQQLGRQMQGLQAMSGANQTAGGLLGQGYGGAQSGVMGAGTLGAQGAAGMTQLSNSGAGYGALGNASLQAGLGSYGMMPGYTQQAAQTPLNAWQYAASMPGQNASTYAQQVMGGMAPYQQQQSMAIPYMNYGAGAISSGAQNQLAQNRFAAGQQQQLGQAVGQMPWGQLSQWFGNQNAPGNPNAFSGYDPSAYSGYASSGGDYYGGG